YPGEDGTIHLQQISPDFRVVSQSPREATNQAATRLLLLASRPVDELSLNVSDVSVSGPNGSLGIADVSLIADGTIAIDLADTFDAEGDYQISFGPNLSAADTALFDQDRDGIGGEAGDDVYVGTLTYDITPPADPAIQNARLTPAFNTVYGDQAILV